MSVLGGRGCCANVWEVKGSHTVSPTFDGQEKSYTWNDFYECFSYYFFSLFIDSFYVDFILPQIFSEITLSLS